MQPKADNIGLEQSSTVLKLIYNSSIHQSTVFSQLNATLVTGMVRQCLIAVSAKKREQTVPRGDFSIS